MTEVLSGRFLACGDDVGFFSVQVRFEEPVHVVVMSGELDLGSRGAAFHACTSPAHVDVIVEMAGLEFMDCAGYGALVAARTILKGRGGSLSLTNPGGEPLRLLSLIEQGENGPRALPSGDSSSFPPVVAPSRRVAAGCPGR